MAHEFEGNMVNEFDADLCTSCPECGCCETISHMKDELGKGFRVCKKCSQEWWTCIDYPIHIDKREKR